MVLLEVSGKAAEFADGAGGCSSQPHVQAGNVSVTDHPAKRLSEVVQVSDLRVRPKVFEIVRLFD